MKYFRILPVLLLWFIFQFAAVAQNQGTEKVAVSNKADARETPAPSSAEQRINAAKHQIKIHPERVQPYNDLASALVRRARETGDPAFYNAAEPVLDHALQLAPDNFPVLKTQAALLLGEHQFARALVKAQALNRRTPDDVPVYGYVAAAEMELGNYQEAETAAQWMLNLRPNNIPGLLIGAELRKVYGDPEGALEFLNQAYSETDSSEPEELAWILNRMAFVQIGSGNPDGAEKTLRQAQQILPGYPYTLENLAQVRIAQHKYGEAVDLLRQANQKSARTETLYTIAQALDKFDGTDSPQAKAAYAEFVSAARLQSNAPDNANRKLILYYADSAKYPEGALKLARSEIAVRHDVGTLDAYAWALCASGQYPEANQQIQKALSVGVRNSRIFFHAGVIASKLNDKQAAAQYFASSLQTDSSSGYSAQATKELTVLAANGIAPAPLSIPEPVTVASSTSAQQAQNRVSSMPVPVSTAVFPASSAPALQPISASLLTPKFTETDRLIKTMQLQVARSPKEPSGYARLGAAFYQRARETGDVAYFELADKALSKSLELGSDDVSATPATLAMAEVYMGEHRFAEALSYAQRAVAQGSGDLSPFGIEGDAYTDMGDYDKAAVAYAKLQQPNLPQTGGSYERDSRVAYLKFIFGDTQSAIQLMRHAIATATGKQLPSENLAWLYFELGEHYFRVGNAVEADRSYLTALTIHPGDYRALAGLAKVRANQGRNQEAVELYQKAIAVVPMPIFVAELGDVYAKMGDAAAAKKQFQLVEYIGQLGAINKVLHNRDLALFYADHDLNLRESLQLAQKELEVRRDIYTWDALAWAFYKNGRLPEAADAMAKAMRLNTQDAMLFFHAGMIAEALGKRAQAAELLQRALVTNPRFHVVYSDVARRQLAKLQSAPNSVETAGQKASNVQ